MSVQTDLRRVSNSFEQSEILLCKGFCHFKFVGTVKQKPKLSPRRKWALMILHVRQLLTNWYGVFLSEKGTLKKSEAHEHFKQWRLEDLSPRTAPHGIITSRWVTSWESHPIAHYPKNLGMGSWFDFIASEYIQLSPPRLFFFFNSAVLFPLTQVI